MTSFRRALAKSLSVRDWPLAVRFIALSVGMAMVLTAGLTTIGYVKATDGLRAEAEAALRSDAALVGNTLDLWNAQHVSDLEILARIPSMARLLRDGQSASPNDVADVARQLSAVVHPGGDVNSVALIGPNGLFVGASIASEMGQDVNFREYFTRPFHTGEPFITGVTISTLTNQPSIFHAVAVKDDGGKVLGVLRSRASMDAIQTIVEAARDRVAPGAAGVLLDADGLVVAHSDNAALRLRPIVAPTADKLDALVKAKMWGNNGAPDAIGDTDMVSAIGARDPTVFSRSWAGVATHALVIPLSHTTWTYTVSVPVESFEASAQDLLRTNLASAGVGLLSFALLVVLAARSVAASIRQVARAAKGLAEGDLDQHVSVASTHDEIGQMATAFRDMIGYHQRMAAIADAVAGGDLSTEVQPQSSRDRLGLALRGMIGNLRQLVARLEERTVQAEQLVRQMQVQISERRQVEQQLRVRERAMAASTTAIVITDLQADGYPIVYVNPAFERLTGYSATDMSTRQLGVLIGPQTGQLEAAEVGAAMRAGRETAVTAMCYRQDGTAFWAELTLAPVREGMARSAIS